VRFEISRTVTEGRKDEQYQQQQQHRAHRHDLDSTATLLQD
jgi:hypothetical protein